ncbi:hypothetical protein IFM89_036251 [Coptis chinensis]|uniref:TFIIS N-terminal domain-containing protein n=1 Tax=Coptis chinensis TaxID=261450 RepID=A0A835HGB9_9MAGN|nr:hypothetical protein IFM89_036251 [Coptis chinensis]
MEYAEAKTLGGLQMGETTPTSTTKRLIVRLKLGKKSVNNGNPQKENGSVKDAYERVKPSSNKGKGCEGGSIDHRKRGKEEDEEIKDLFNMGKKQKRVEKTAGEIALWVEKVMAELELAVEEDGELNRKSMPAVNKLMKLPLLKQLLSKKQYQLEFLDHGVLALLKYWLEPLPDGSLPNIAIRTAILEILSDYPVGLEESHRREELRKSGIGKVIMFLSKYNEESTGNRRLARNLVYKWSRFIFCNSTQYDDMIHDDNEERLLYKKPVKRPATGPARLEYRDDDLGLANFQQRRKSSQPSSTQYVVKPEALPLDFVDRPESKINPAEFRARAAQMVHDQMRLRVGKKLQNLKAKNKRPLQAMKLSVEGRRSLLCI